jgi:hypothetical protein
MQNIGEGFKGSGLTKLSAPLPLSTLAKFGLLLPRGGSVSGSVGREDHLHDTVDP